MKKTILFQGDSITDCKRDYDANETHPGQGYPALVAAYLGSKYPNKYEFINKGVSGHKAPQLLERWQRDALEHKPDILSLLLGVNDVWHFFADEKPDDNTAFENNYCKLLDLCLEQNPNLEIIILQPFIIKAPAQIPVWDKWSDRLWEKQEIVERIAGKYNAIYIPLQKLFDEVFEDDKPEYWAADGVHPTLYGHGLIAGKWLEYSKLA